MRSGEKISNPILVWKIKIEIETLQIKILEMFFIAFLSHHTQLEKKINLIKSGIFDHISSFSSK